MHVHLIAACGTAMGTLAGILVSQGHRVTGSDLNIYPPMSLMLERLGIPLFNGYSPAHLEPRPDCVVIGNAIRKDNPEARAAIDGGIPYLSMTDALARFFIAERTSVVVAGTHGKTTTTSLIAHILVTAGLDPHVFVGGVAHNLNSGFRLGEGRYAVLEGDEYDTAFFDKTPKFWHYRAQHALITHLEYDHADIYPTIESIEAVFRTFVQSLPESGSLTACASAPRVAALVKEARCTVQTYSAHGADSDFTAALVTTTEQGSRFEVQHHGRVLGLFEAPLFGRHNVENALGALAMAMQLGVAPSVIQQAFTTFAGVKRRMEVRGVIGGVTVIDDFAHHPTAVKATLSAVRSRFQHSRIIALFEPRSQTSRRSIFQDDYVEALSGADWVLLAAPFGTEALAPEARLSSEKICSDLTQRGIRAQSCESAEAILQSLKPEARPGDVIVVMSNGGFMNIHPRLLTALENLPAAPTSI